MNQIENTTTPVRLRKIDLKRLETYYHDGDNTPASAVSRVLDLHERASATISQINEIVLPKRSAKTDELIAKTDELIAKTDELTDILRSEQQ